MNLVFPSQEQAMVHMTKAASSETDEAGETGLTAMTQELLVGELKHSSNHHAEECTTKAVR